jgi:hypothetical protein
MSKASRHAVRAFFFSPHFHVFRRACSPSLAPTPPRSSAISTLILTRFAVRSSPRVLAPAMATAAAPTGSDAATPPFPFVPLWRRLTRWRQTSHEEGRAAEAGVYALSG